MRKPLARWVRFLGLAGLCACAGRSELAVPPYDAGTDAPLPPVPGAPEKHRPKAVACDPARVVPEPTNPIPSSTCKSHADCTQGRNGRCTLGVGWSATQYSCSYDLCADDSECGGRVCSCETGVTVADICFPQGNCLVDSDCGAGGFCSPSYGSCGAYSGVVGYFCHTSKDQCKNDSDCGTPSTGAYCAYIPLAGAWQCSTSMCAG